LAQEERFGASGELGLGHLAATHLNNGPSAPSRDAMWTADASRAEALSETERAHCWVGIERVPWHDRGTGEKAIFGMNHPGPHMAALTTNADNDKKCSLKLPTALL